MDTKDLIQELSQNFIEYAVACNSDRAIPNATDGLKPVAKRILYGAFITGRTSSKPHVKNARIVGDVMGSLHPHGDSSIYGALVRLSQEWVMRYPLIDFHGNKGNISGDGPAAYRYTEGRLAKITEDGMLTGLKKNNVDFIPNYDETLDEPITLPSIFPNLLCNPNAGIGVAMACSWAPHNLKEVAQAIDDYLNGKEPMLPGPDFPTGGLVVNKNDIPTIMKTGHGSVKIRGQYKIEGNDIVFYEIPYGETVEGLLTEIGKVCDNKEIEGISEVQNQSNKKGLRIVIKCAKGVDKDRIIQQLFWKTKLQTSFSYNQVALIDKTPAELTLKKCIEIYVNHNINCIIREAKFDHKKAIDRLHIVDGLLKALEDIDNVIALIKKSANAADAKETLIQTYNFTEVQAKAILAMRLSNLASLEKIELIDEQAKLNETIKELNALINTYDLQVSELKERLSNIVNKYGDNRRTQLAQIELPAKEEKEKVQVEPQKCVVIMTEDGYIKRVPITSFKLQKKNGRGIKTLNDIQSTIIRTNTIDSLMIFTNTGKLYRIVVSNIPEGTNSQKGVPVKSLIQMEPKEEPSLIYSIYKDTSAKYVVFATKNGLIKRTLLDEYVKVRRKIGTAAIGLKEGDSLVSVSLMNEEDILILTKKGVGIRIQAKDITIQSKGAKGVRGIKLDADDAVIALLPIRNKDDMLALYTSVGMGKKFPLKEIMCQGRGGKGIICYKSPKDVQEEVVAATLIDNNDSILIVGNNKSLCIPATDIPLKTRIATGSKLFKGTISAVSKV